MATHTVGIIVLALHCISGSHGQGLAPTAYSIVASPGSCPYTQQSWECRPGQPGPRLYNHHPTHWDMDNESGRQPPYINGVDEYINCQPCCYLASINGVPSTIPQCQSRRGRDRSRREGNHQCARNQIRRVQGTCRPRSFHGNYGGNEMEEKTMIKTSNNKECKYCCLQSGSNLDRCGSRGSQGRNNHNNYQPNNNYQRQPNNYNNNNQPNNNYNNNNYQPRRSNGQPRDFQPNSNNFQRRGQQSYEPQQQQ